MNKRYINLISRVRTDYKNNFRDNGNVRLTWCDTDESDNLCREINLWTYWQGWRYSERQDKVKILLLGQDWGNPYSTQNFTLRENIRKMNEGIDVPYLFGCHLDSKISQTDRNLIKFFSEIGHPDIDVIRYPDLFFCNFSLGYRTGTDTGGMTEDLLEADLEYIKELIDILTPEKIICLGESVTRVTEKLLFGRPPKYKNYNEYIDSGVVLNYQCGAYKCDVYPMFHPGFYGEKNRVGGFTQHIEDWKRILL
ncbi:MAG: hypothetical protein VZR24_13835 [Butyrivibrio hungatei]|nr:hypothetical protein [Butyrivibrio hungatei]